MESKALNQGINVPCKHLVTKEAARLMGISHRTLEDWRLTGNGPRFIKLGRRVVYRFEILMEFMDERMRLNTGEGLVGT